jgi:predicted metal-binding protein
MFLSLVRCLVDWELASFSYFSNFLFSDTSRVLTSDSCAIRYCNSCDFSRFSSHSLRIEAKSLYPSAPRISAI